MKKIFNLLVVFSLVLLYSCDYNNSDFDTTDQLTGTAAEGGAIVAVSSDTEGKLLGVPSSLDFETATVAFAETSLDMTVILMSGGTSMDGYAITKSLNGGAETVVAQSATLPVTLTYSSAADFVDGLGIDADGLRIGDVITFRTQMTRADGSIVFAGPNDGSYSVTISCSSDLAGTYDLTVVRSSDGSNYFHPGEVLSVKGVGIYKTSTTGGWAQGSIAPDQGYDFSDICGALTVLDQGLAQGYYGNDVYNKETGFVDGVTGNLYTYYTIWSSGWTDDYESYYTKL